MPRCKVWLIISTTIFVVLVLVLITALRPAPPNPARVQITFLSITNVHATDTRQNKTFPLTVASFCVSNAGSRPLFGGGGYSYESQYKPIEPLFSVRTSDFQLKEGQVKTLWTVDPPVSFRPWRVSLTFSIIDWRYKLGQKYPKIYATLWRFMPRAWLTAPKTNFYSDWVTNRESEPTSPTPPNAQ